MGPHRCSARAPYGLVIETSVEPMGSCRRRSSRCRDGRAGDDPAGSAEGV